MKELTESMIALIEEAARAGTERETVYGMVKDLQKNNIDPQEVLDNLHKTNPPYSDAAIAKAMTDTFRAHREK